MIAKIILRLMKHMKDVLKTQIVLQIISSVKRPIFVLNLIGFVMAIMIAEIIQMKIHSTVLKEHVHRTALDVQIIVVYQQLGEFFIYFVICSRTKENDFIFYNSISERNVKERTTIMNNYRIEQ